MTTILAATGNQHKLRELREILAPLGIQVQGANEIGGIPDVEEDGLTFRDNAVKKALTVAAATGRYALADDSGLVVHALDGRPGVRSARYAGEKADDRDNVRKLLGELAGVADRRAKFVCVLAVATPTGLVGTATGEVPGHIIDTPRGSAGFGYDPVFVPNGFDLTFAELTAATKHSLSHRGNALKNAIQQGLFNPQPGSRT